jgi:hypothetical protein
MRGTWLIVCLSLVIASCNGAIGDPGTDPPIDPVDPPSPVECEDAPTVGAPVPMRRLTQPQLEATVADVLGSPAIFGLSDETLIGYRANTTGVVDTTGARTVMFSAEDVAEVMAGRLARAPECATDCGAFVLDTFATRLFRRPIDSATRARFTALYDAGVAEGGPAEGARWLLEGMLQSPRFLYMLEVETADGRLDGYSVASRLSYALWGGPPDDSLLDAANRGDLDTPEGVALSADAMIDDPRFVRGLGDFVGQWLDLEELEHIASRPDVGALPIETRVALVDEPVAFVAAHIREGATLSALLTSTQTVHDPALDVIAHLDPARRAGLMTLPGVLSALSHASETSPTLRGRFVLANLLCTPPPAPPAGVNPTLPPAMPGATTRERLEAHFSDETCAGCHAAMDGIGFTFEKLDWVGRSREEEGGRAIDTSAEFTIGRDEVAVDGAAELAAELAGRPQVAECVARHLSRFASGVTETNEFACTAQDLAEIAEGPTGLRGMFVAYVSSPWFLTPAAPMEAE